MPQTSDHSPGEPATPPPLLEVVFVDDERRILDGLQRMLRPMRNQWRMRFFDSPVAALAALAEVPADIVVSDMRMPVMNGAELLETVRTRWPGTVRMILSGHADLELVRRTIGPTHQYLAKPCEVERLRETICRTTRLHRLLGNRHLRDLVGDVRTLPSIPQLYLDLKRVLASRSATTATVAELIERDLAMSAKVLQLVNSAFFAQSRPVSQVQQAVSILGMDTLQNLVLMAQAFDYATDAQVDIGVMEGLWHHSAGVARLARTIAVQQGSTPLACDEIHAAGYLHDIGRLIIAVRCPEAVPAIQALMREGRELAEAETVVLGSSHAEIGAYLLGLWGLPDSIVECVAWHHRPIESGQQEFSGVLAIHVADSLIQHQDHEPGAPAVQAEVLNAAGCAQHLPSWVATAQLLAGVSRS